MFKISFLFLLVLGVSVVWAQSGGSVVTIMSREPVTVVKSLAETTDPGGEVVKPQAVTTDPGGEVVKPQAVTTDPGGEVVKPQAVTTDPGGEVVKPQACGVTNTSVEPPRHTVTYTTGEGPGCPTIIQTGGVSLATCGNVQPQVNTTAKVEPQVTTPKVQPQVTTPKVEPQVTTPKVEPQVTTPTVGVETKVIIVEPAIPKMRSRRRRVKRKHVWQVGKPMDPHGPGWCHIQQLADWRRRLVGKYNSGKM